MASDDSMENWVSNFGVPIAFEALTSTKRGFSEIPPPSTTAGAGVKNTLSNITRLKLSPYNEIAHGAFRINYKKIFFGDFGISILRWEGGGGNKG